MRYQGSTATSGNNHELTQCRLSKLSLVIIVTRFGVPKTHTRTRVHTFCFISKQQRDKWRITSTTLPLCLSAAPYCPLLAGLCPWLPKDGTGVKGHSSLRISEALLATYESHDPDLYTSLYPLHVAAAERHAGSRLLIGCTRTGSSLWGRGLGRGGWLSLPPHEDGPQEVDSCVGGVGVALRHTTTE